MPHAQLSPDQFVRFEGGNMHIPGESPISLIQNPFLIRIVAVAGGYDFHFDQGNLNPGQSEKIYTEVFDQSTFGQSGGTVNGFLTAGLVRVYDPASTQGYFNEFALSGIGISDILDVKPDNPDYKLQKALKLYHSSYPDTWKAEISYHRTERNGYYLVQTIRTGMTHYVRIAPSDFRDH